MKHKIILIDDSKLGPILNEMLRNERGYLTYFFTTGAEAISSIGETSYFDLALVDVGLPDMPGERVIEYLRDKYPLNPVFCISSYRNYQSPAASRTIHKGSASRIKKIAEILEDCVNRR